MGEAGLAGWIEILNPDITDGGPCRVTPASVNID